MNSIVYDPKSSRLYSGDGVGAIVVWRRTGGGRAGVEDYNVLRKARGCKNESLDVPFHICER